MRSFFLILLGVPLLALVAWGCAQTTGARALPGLRPGAVARAEELRYQVHGTTVGDIRGSLRAGATGTLGGSSTGRHSWEIRWSYRYREYERSCDVTEVTIDLNSVINLPEWVDREAAPDSVVAMWDGYISALRNHEHCHRVLAYRSANEISREVGRIREFNCGALVQRARTTGRTILDRFNRVNSEYDQEARGSITFPSRPDAPEPPVCPVGD
ncbi:DUF922 domain-containing protein [Gemmatimonadota bacterium]